MQPDDHQYPTNYLDTIAAQPQVKTVNPVVLWAMIGGVLVLAVAVLFAVLGAGASPTDKLTRFGARLSDLQTVSSESQEKIKSDELRTLNSNLTLILTNANRDLKQPFASLGIKLEDKKQRSVTTVAAETKQLNDRLEDARLNAIFDRTYAREMSFYIKQLRTEMRELHAGTKDKELKEVLETTDSNLSPLLTGFSDFNEN